MKQFLATILALVYLSGSMGAGIHQHYCIGNKALLDCIGHADYQSSHSGTVKKTNPSSFMASHMDCCKDENKKIQTGKDQHFIPINSTKNRDIPRIVPKNDYFIQTPAIGSNANDFTNINAPPFKDKLPLFVLYRNFRI